MYTVWQWRWCGRVWVGYRNVHCVTVKVVWKGLS